jgi:hypothetical protein
MDLMLSFSRLWLVLLLIMCIAVDKTKNNVYAAPLEVDVDSFSAESGVTGFCEAELKNLRAAIKTIGTELSVLESTLDKESSGISELNRIWKLFRNQEIMVDKSFDHLNSKFSEKVRNAYGVETINAQNATGMADLFFGGDPYFVQCASELEPLHRAFSEAAKELLSLGVTPVALNCREKLPSGKTSLERFFPGRRFNRSEPFFFVVSNRQNPRAVNMKSLVTTESFASFIFNATKPKIISVSSQEDFRENCLRRKQCAVVVYNGSISEQDQAVVDSLVSRHRRIAFVDVDSKKWSLSFEDSLPQNGPGPR